MKRILSLGSVAIVALSACQEPAQKSVEFHYPETKKVDTVDIYHGHKVLDPYRWLEDDRSAETGKWVDAQNKVTSDFLMKVPYRKQIEERLTEIYNYPKVGSPRKVGDYYFIAKNDGLQNQNVYYYKKGLDGEEKVFLDPNAINPDGTTSISLRSESKDKKYMAYIRSDAGSDWQKIRVRDIAKNEDLTDEIQWVKFSNVAWYKGGFYYSGYSAPEKGSELSAKNEFHSIYYHKLGTSQSEDKLIYKNSEKPLLYHSCGVTEDQKYLIMMGINGTEGYEVYYKDLTKKNADWSNLISGYESRSNILHHYDGKFIMKTNIDAPKYRIVEVDLKKPGKENWREVAPETEFLLEGISMASNKYLFVSYLEHATTKVYRMKLDGSGKTMVKLPGVGSARGFSADKDETNTFFSFTSFVEPSVIYEMDVESMEYKEYYRPKLGFNPKDYQCDQVFYESKDGTKVPMFIVYKKGLKKDGTNPTYLYGYGGFNINMKPSFRISNVVLLENGGIYAMPNLRGGGEYGEEWHKSGMLMNKQNVFDDFIGAAEYLIKEGYTSSEKLALAGGSNGGLLVGACMTQRPELAKVAYPMVGVMDMLRYHKFTVGWGWVPEFGSSEQSEEMFQYLKGYSPIHNLKAGTNYPATMVMTADHDDRVVPAHSFKFAATLQECHKGENPVLIRIEKNAGHGAGKPISKYIEEEADRWSFMFYNMGEKVSYQ